MEVEDRRSAGRLKNTWRQSVKEDLRGMNIREERISNHQEWERLTAHPTPQKENKDIKRKRRGRTKPTKIATYSTSSTDTSGSQSWIFSGMPSPLCRPLCLIVGGWSSLLPPSTDGTWCQRLALVTSVTPTATTS